MPASGSKVRVANGQIRDVRIVTGLFVKEEIYHEVSFFKKKTYKNNTNFYSMMIIQMFLTIL